MLSYLFRHKSGASLTFIILFSLSSLIWQSNIIAQAGARTIIILDFFTETFHSLGTAFTRFFDSYRSYSALQNERDALRSQLQSALTAHIELKRLERENESMRQLLSMPAASSSALVAAEVISQDPDNWFRTIIINKGSKHGLAPYMPVLAVQTIPPEKEGDQPRVVYGVVGKIIQVNPYSARILPILDQFSRIGIMLEKSGHWGLLIGRNPQSRYPILKYISLNVLLQKGDMVITSGGDGIFPKGLPVGILRKEISRQGTFQTAELEPSIDFKKLNYVLVMQKEPDTSLSEFMPLSRESVTEPPSGPPAPPVNPMSDQKVPFVFEEDPGLKPEGASSSAPANAVEQTEGETP